MPSLPGIGSEATMTLEWDKVANEERMFDTDDIFQWKHAEVLCLDSELLKQ